MYVKVRVQAHSKQEKVEKKSPDHYHIWVKEPAERNLANNRVCELVALDLHIPSKMVRIISGHHSPSKILSILI